MFGADGILPTFAGPISGEDPEGGCRCVLFLAVHANVAQLVEQLICNQPVVGSSPSIGSVRGTGEIPKWPTGADCKSAVLRLRRFESCSPHKRSQPGTPGIPGTSPHTGICGSSSVGRASAFQAECRGFESRLPLHHTALTALRGGGTSLCSSGVEHFLCKEEVPGSIPGKGSG